MATPPSSPNPVSAAIRAASSGPIPPGIGAMFAIAAAPR